MTRLGGWIATGSLLALGLAGCDQMARGAHDAVRDAEAASVDAVPDDTVVGRLRQDFPKDYEQLRTQAAEIATDGGSAAQVSEASGQFMRRFYATHQGGLDQAPDADLIQLARADAALMAAARASEGDAACAAIWGGGYTASDHPAPVRAALEQVGEVRITAIRHGIDHPANRDAVSANPADWSALNAAAARYGVSKEQIAASGSLSKADECRVGRTVYGVISTLPPDQGATLMAFLTHTEAALKAAASRAPG